MLAEVISPPPVREPPPKDPAVDELFDTSHSNGEEEEEETTGSDTETAKPAPKPPPARPTDLETLVNAAWALGVLEQVRMLLLSGI